MTPREVLAANLQRLMDATPGLATLKTISAAGGGSHGTVDRIRRAVTGTSVDNLAPLAEVFGVEPWHLLMPTLRAHQSGHSRPRVSGVPVWPFTPELAETVTNLSPEELSRLENVVRAFLGLAPVSVTNYSGASPPQQTGQRREAIATPALDREHARLASEDGQDGNGQIGANRRKGRRGHA